MTNFKLKKRVKYSTFQFKLFIFKFLTSAQRHSLTFSLKECSLFLDLEQCKDSLD